MDQELIKINRLKLKIYNNNLTKTVKLLFFCNTVHIYAAKLNKIHLSLFQNQKLLYIFKKGSKSWCLVFQKRARGYYFMVGHNCEWGP
jgi:hypothetical protein